MQRVLLDLKAADGRDAFLRLADGADVVIESFRPGVVDRLGIGYETPSRRVNPRHRLLLDHRLRPGRARTRSGPGTTSTTSRSAATSHCSGRDADGGPALPGRHRRRQRGRRHARGDRDPRRARAPRARPARARTSTSRSPTACVALMALARRRVPRHRRRARRRATTSSPAATPATTPTAARDGKWLAVAAIEPRFWANLCRRARLAAVDRAPDRRRACRTRSAPTCAPRSPPVTATSGSPSSARPTRCVAPVLTVPEVVDDAQFAARGDVRRRAPHRRGDFRQVGPVLAGMQATGRPVRGALTRRSPTPTRCSRGAGLSDDELAALREEGVVA